MRTLLLAAVVFLFIGCRFPPPQEVVPNVCVVVMDDYPYVMRCDFPNGDRCYVSRYGSGTAMACKFKSQ